MQSSTSLDLNASTEDATATLSDKRLSSMPNLPFTVFQQSIAFRSVATQLYPLHELRAYDARSNLAARTKASP
jgi:hypothetical protein